MFFYCNFFILDWLRQIREEFGSFGGYCWGFVNQKPIVSRFRYPRQVPVKTPKAEAVSKDMVRRGFRCVGPTVVYSFMQAAGITNDHLVTCHRFHDCCAAAGGAAAEKAPSHEAEEEEPPVAADESPPPEAA